MKKFIILSVIALLLLSCENQSHNASSHKKKYQYVEQVRKKTGNNKFEIVEKEPKIITETSDTSAYAAAFMWFCFDYKTFQDLLAEGVNSAVEPTGFKLYNSDGEDISNIEFATKTETEKELISEFISGESMFDGMYSKNSTGLGAWYIKSYIDEFQEETETKYIGQIVHGNFSNSVTTRSNLTAIIIIDKDDFRLRLEEYDSYIVKDKGSYIFKVKDSEGEVSEFEMYNSSDGYYEFHYGQKLSDRDKMISIMLKGGIVKFYGVSKYQNSSSTYNFSVHCEGLQNAIDELYK